MILLILVISSHQKFQVSSYICHKIASLYNVAENLHKFLSLRSQSLAISSKIGSVKRQATDIEHVLLGQDSLVLVGIRARAPQTLSRLLNHSIIAARCSPSHISTAHTSFYANKSSRFGQRNPRGTSLDTCGSWRLSRSSRPFSRFDIS